VPALALMLPFLDPFTFGPSTPAHQYFLCGFCAVAAMALIAAKPLAATEALWRGLGLAAILSAAVGALQLAGVAQLAFGWVNVPGGEEVYANLRQRNQLATLLAMGVLVCGTVLASRRVVAMGLGAALVVMLAATASRTGLAQLGFVIGLVLVWAWRSQARATRSSALWAVAMLVIYGLASVLLAYGVDGKASILMRDRIGGEGCSSRSVLWSNVWDLIAQKPWTGWGWGNLDGAHFLGVFPQRFCDILDNAHNLPLHLAVELGIPLALLVCGAVAVFMWRTYPRASSDPKSLTGRRVAWGALVLMLLHSQLEYPLWYGPFQLTAVVCVLVLIGHREKLVRAISAAIAGVLLVVTPYALWQYVRVSQIYLPPEQRVARWADKPLPDAREVPWFVGQRNFAWLSVTELTADNAAEQNVMARQLLFYSPEGRVVERIIDSYRLMGLPLEALPWMQRFKAAYPSAYADWLQRSEAAERNQLGADAASSRRQ
jgi:O-antigen ligase